MTRLYTRTTTIVGAGLCYGGAAVWAGMAVLARMGIARIGAIELIFLFAPLVIVPLGMELGRMLGAAGCGSGAAVAAGGGCACGCGDVASAWEESWAVALGWLVVCVLMAGAEWSDWFALRG